MRTIVIKTDVKEIANFQNDLQTTDCVGLDIETTGLNPWDCTIKSIQVKVNDNYYIFDCKYFKNISYLADLLNTKTCVGHNIKFDAKFLLVHSGVNLINVYDTMIGEAVLNMGKTKNPYYSLQQLVKKYFNIELSKTIREEFIDSEDMELTQEQIIYSALDVKYLIDIMYLQRESDPSLERTLDLEMRLVPVVVAMEVEGIELDIPRWEALTVKAGEDVERLNEEVRTILLSRIDISKYKNLYEFSLAMLIPVKLKRDRLAIETISYEPAYRDYFMERFNLSSWKQILNILNMIGIDVSSTGEKVLKKYNLGKNDPVIEKILEYRERIKKFTSYGDNIIKKLNPHTGRIHAEFNQTGTVTGRFSSSDPNMQNWPNEYFYRSCIIAGKGWDFLVPDYSQQELRVAGASSKEPKIIESYLNGVDMHQLTGSIIFDVPLNEVTYEQRQAGKTYNFATLYGTTEYGLAHNFGISVDEAIEQLNRYYAGYPTLAKFKELVEKEIIRRKYSVTLNGRKRFFTTRDIYDDPRDYTRELEAMKREGFNMLIQGTGADILKISMCIIYYGNPFGDPTRPLQSKLKIVNSTHDEITVKVDKSITQEAREFVVKSMVDAEQPFLGEIEAVVSVDVSDSWTKGDSWERNQIKLMSHSLKK